MKKFVSGLIIGILLTLSITTFAAVELEIIPNPYKVLIDGKTADVHGYNINGSTYLKLTDFVEAGLGVNFNKDTNQIEISTPSTTTEQKEGESVEKQPSNSSNKTQPNTSATKPETLEVIDVTFDNGTSKN